MLSCWNPLISDSQIRNLITLFSISVWIFIYICFLKPFRDFRSSFFIEAAKWIHVRTKPTSSLPASGHAVIFFQKLHLVTDRAFLQDFSELLEKKLKPKRNQIKTKCYSETFMQYLIENPEATHFCLLTNIKKLEQISRNGLKKLYFCRLIILFVWEQFDRQIVGCSLPLLSRRFVDLLPAESHARS
jgi:hypothetical protein